MKKIDTSPKIIIDPSRKPWPHELETARVLALAGHRIEFLKETDICTPDILLDGVEFEIKAPKTSKTRSLEQVIRKALKQSHNIVIDSFRMKMRDGTAKRFLIKKCREQKQIKRMLFINKRRQIVDIFVFV